MIQYSISGWRFKAPMKSMFISNEFRDSFADYVQKSRKDDQMIFSEFDYTNKKEYETLKIQVEYSQEKVAQTGCHNKLGIPYWIKYVYTFKHDKLEHTLKLQRDLESSLPRRFYLANGIRVEDYSITTVDIVKASDGIELMAQQYEEFKTMLNKLYIFNTNGMTELSIDHDSLDSDIIDIFVNTGCIDSLHETDVSETYCTKTTKFRFINPTLNYALRFNVFVNPGEDMPYKIRSCVDDMMEVVLRQLTATTTMYDDKSGSVESKKQCWFKTKEDMMNMLHMTAKLANRICEGTAAIKNLCNVSVKEHD